MRTLAVTRIKKRASLIHAAGLAVTLIAVPFAPPTDDRVVAPAAIGVAMALPGPNVATAPAQMVAPAGLGVQMLSPAPSVARVAASTIAPAGLGVPVGLAAPAVSKGGQTIAPAGLSVPVGLPAPVVGGSGAQVGPAAVPVAVGLPAPMVASVAPIAVAPAALTVGIALAAPSLTQPAQAVAMPGLGTGVALVAPVVTNLVQAVAPAGLGVAVALATPAVSVASSYDIDAASYFAAMTVQPDATRKGLLNDLVVGLKADGVWAQLDWLLLLAAHNAQAGRVNVVVPSKVAAAINSPSFTADRGYTGDGASAYISYGESYGGSGKQYVRDNATLGVWVVSSATAALGQMGGQGSSGLLLTTASTSIGWRVNQTTAFNISTAAIVTRPTRSGHVTASRSGASLSTGYINGMFVADSSTTSSALSGATATVLLQNATYSPDRAIAAYSGASLTTAQAAALHNRLSTFLTAIGAN